MRYVRVVPPAPPPGTTSLDPRYLVMYLIDIVTGERCERPIPVPRPREPVLEVTKRTVKKKPGNKLKKMFKAASRAVRM